MPDGVLTIEAVAVGDDPPSDATPATTQDKPPAAPKVTGLAYGGGKINLPGWKYPVVVDTAGLELPDSVPLLANHENRTQARVGMVRAALRDGALYIDGEIVATGGMAEGIVAQARAGADWQLSIGAEVRASALVRAGESREVNGRRQDGPFFHVTRAALREVSVVAVGADGGTRLKVAAHFVLLGGPSMDKVNDPKFDQWLQDNGLRFEGMTETALDKLRLAFDLESKPADKPEATPPASVTAAAPAAITPPAPTPSTTPAPSAKAEVTPPATEPVAAGSIRPLQAEAHLNDIRQTAEEAVRHERERIAAIQGVCDGEYPDIEREAIRANWSADQAGQEVLKRIRASRPAPDARVASFASAPKPDTTKTLEAALCLRSGVDDESLVASYGEAVVEAAHHDRQMAIQELFARCLRMEGKYFRSFDHDAIRAGFSTVSLPGILSNVANKKLLTSFKGQPIVATKLCGEGDLANFNEAHRYRLTDVGDLEPVAADGKIKHGAVTEEQATNQIDTWGKSFTLTRKMIINDDLGSFMKIPAGLGAKAARKIDVLFFQRLMKNPAGLFSDKHRNLLAGADSGLSADSLALAVQLFLDQTDADGQSINIQPRFLLVPTSLRIAARELLNSVTFNAVGATDKLRVPTYNALRDENLEVVSSAYLSNKNYQGFSPKAWYLFGDPTVIDTFEIGYLKGQRTPTVEKTTTDFDELGMRFRVYFDIGVREQDYRGVLKANGQ